MESKKIQGTLSRLENVAKLAMQPNTEMTIDKINNLEQATIFIKENDSNITNAWFNMAHALKKVRDEKLYEHKYEDFQSYFEAELNYKKTMVYQFIKIADKYNMETKEEILHLGVTKLIELSEINEEIREDFIKENDLENMSVKEIKTKIKNKDDISNHGINIDNHDVKFNLSPDERLTVKKLHGVLTGFKEVVEKVSKKQDEDELLSHEQICYLKEVLDKTKKDMRKVEKMIKKYI